MRKIPNFCKILREELVPILEKAEENFLAAIRIMKQECLIFENNIQPDQVFIELAQVILLMREYRPRIGFRNIRHSEISEDKREEFMNDIK